MTDRRKKVTNGERLAIADAYEAGETQSELAVRYGVTQRAVSAILGRLPIKTRTPREAAPPSFDVRRAVALYQDGMTGAEVAASLGKSVTAVMEQLRRLGITRAKSGRFSSREVRIAQSKKILANSRKAKVTLPVVVPDFFGWARSAGAEQVSDSEVVLDELRVRFFDLDVQSELKLLSSGIVLEEGCLYLFSDEWAKRTEQCKSFILAHCGRFEIRVAGRKCEVSVVSDAIATEFLNRYHIQGASRLRLIAFGLFFAGELLGLMSLGRHTRQIAENRVVLDRLCFKSGVVVVGGSARLMKRAAAWAKDAGYDEILSFSDCRWTPGSVYPRLGFTLDSVLRPDYRYVSDGVLISKQSQKNSATGCPADRTESQWARDRGLVRIYDAGKKRWVFNLRPAEHAVRRDVMGMNAVQQHQNGVHVGTHLHGEFWSVKNGKVIYFASSYELRCLYLLENDDDVVRFSRGDTFKTAVGWRNPDFRVEHADGFVEVLEVKPEDRLGESAVVAQINDSRAFAEASGVGFRTWTEKDSGLPNSAAILTWAKKFLAAQGNTSYADGRSAARKKTRRRYYESRIENDKVTVRCEFCECEHTALRLTYDKNIARNGTYICERYGGYLAGKRSKDHLKKTNPYAAEGKKQCSQCNEVKETALFDGRKASWDGLAARCKACVSATNRTRYENRKLGQSKENSDEVRDDVAEQVAYG